MAENKSDIVKISVDGKHKTLHLEASQGFVEKNLESMFSHINNNGVASDDILLFELYKNTLGELIHHENIINKLVTGLAIILPVFLTVIVFLFSEESISVVNNLHTLKIIIEVALTICIIIFWISYFLMIKRLQKCTDMSVDIEEKIRQKHATDYSELFIESKLRNKGFTFIGMLRAVIYVVISLAFLAVVGLFFFCWT